MVTTRKERVDPETGEILEDEEHQAIELHSGGAVALPSSQLISHVVSRLPGGRLAVKHLPRLVTPAVGANWRLPTLQGLDDRGRSFEAVILGVSVNRAFWSHDIGEGNPAPDCFSPDGKQGFGEPGVACRGCVFSQWGSGKLRGQACREYRTLLAYPTNSRQVLPTIVRIAPASLDRWDRYQALLAAHGLVPEDVVTTLQLVDETSREGGIAFTAVDFEMVDELPEDLRKDTGLLWHYLTTALGFRELAEAIETTAVEPEPLPAEVYEGLDEVAS